MQPLTVDRAVLARLPLAEAVLLLLRHALLPQHCQDLFERRKERCYTKLLTFDVFVRVLSDALLQYRGSGRKACAAARFQGYLTTSHQAFYGKLANLPLRLSEAFLAENSARLLSLVPALRATPLPASLAGLDIQVVDGKVIKRLAKKLKVLRRVAGGVLGGKGLVALDLRRGLVTALATTADGLTNDAALVAPLVAQVRGVRRGVLLWLGDRQFCDLTQPRSFQGHGDHFLVRYCAKTHFYPDPQAGWAQARPDLAAGTDDRGRPWRQEWGWLGTPGADTSLYVRRLTLDRPGEETVVLVTDLLDPVAYPAADLLAVYLLRWDVEQLFQKITEVFSLRQLISCRPKGTVFQLSFCLLLYNVIQVVRSHIAAGQEMPVEAVSTEMLFGDVERQLTGLAEVVGAEGIAQVLPAVLPAAQLRARLKVLLGKLWEPMWRKTTNKKRRAHQTKAKGRQHKSAQRILDSSLDWKKNQRIPQLVGSSP